MTGFTASTQFPCSGGYSCEHAGGEHDAYVAHLDADLSRDPIGIEDTPAPARLHLLGAHPNPFNPWTEVHFSLAARSAVQIAVFGVDGRRVTSLADCTLAAGHHVVAWDGRDEAGRSLPSGIYMVHLRTGGDELVTKVTLAR